MSKALKELSAASLYVGRVCALLDAERSAHVRLGGSIVLDVVLTSDNVALVSYAGRSVVLLRSHAGLYYLSEACEQLGWRFRVEDQGSKHEEWKVWLRKSPAYEEHHDD